MIKDKNIIINKIKELQNRTEVLNSKIRNLNVNKSNLLTEFKEDTKTINDKYNLLTISELQSLTNQLGVKCENLTELNKLLEELNNELSELPNNENLINDLKIQLKNLEETETEQPEIDLPEEIDLGEGLKSGMSKVWIDENMGIYMLYDKADVIASTMKCFYGSVENLSGDTLKTVGYEDKDELYLELSQIDRPGLPSLMGIFIDLVVKAIGSFAKQFFVLKNTIDLLAGLELGELLGSAIPMIGKVIADIKKFLTDTKEWLFEQVLGPMFDVNIPIPEFEFDLGSIIPLLPIKLSIPEIDNLGLFSKDTPLNIDADQTKIPLTWLEDIIEEYKVDQKKLEEEEKSKEKILTDSIESDIIDLRDKLYGTSINSIDNQLKTIELELKKIEQEYNSNKIKFEQKDITITEKILNENCNVIKRLNEKKELLLTKKKRKIEDIKTIDKEAIKKDLEAKQLELQKMKSRPVLTEKDFRKRATLLQYRINSPDLTQKLSEIYYMGIDVFNNDVINYMQRLGHNFNDDKYLTKIKELQDLGIDFNNTKLLKRLFDIGYNLNDEDYKSKISRFMSFVDINNTEIINYLIKMGFNINANFNHIVQLTNLKISFKETIIMENLFSIGFNFNNSHIIQRLIKLAKYIDISDPVAYRNILKKNINLNNPYFENIIKRTKRIGLSWSDENFEETEQEILNINVNDIDYLLDVLDKFKAPNNQLYLYKLYSSSGETSFSNIYNFIDSVQPSTNTTFKTLSRIPTIFKTEPLDQYYIDNEGITHNINGTYYLSNQYTYLYDYGLYKIDINKFSKYGISIEFPSDFNLKSYKSNKYSYPNGTQTFKVPLLGGMTAYEYKLLLMKNFILNQGWVIDGVNASRQPNLVDYQKIIDASNQSGLKLTTDINAKDNQISADALQGIYGNFDKLGLNLKDDDFEIKVQQFTNLLNIKLDETVFINTERQVLLTYRDYKNKNKEITIDLNKQNADPKLYEDPKYNANIEIINIRDENAVEQPTKPLVQFDALNKLGLNFQNIKYYSLLTKMNGLSFDISKFKVSDIVDNLISLGWHFNLDNNFYKLDKLISIGFSFLVEPISGENFSANDMASKLNSLNNIGFNFNKDLAILDSLKQLGFNMKNKDFESAIQEIMSFGINFNDDDWKVKIDKLSNLQINFSADNWENKMSNLRMLGINFIDDDWLRNYDKVFEYKTFGIDYNNEENTKKIEILNSIGLKFTDIDYKEKFDGLIRIGIADIPQDVLNEKYNIENEWKTKLYNIDKEIVRLQNIKNSTNQNLPNINNQLDLLFQKRISDAPKTFNINKNLSLNTLDKIKSLNTLNFNFYDPDWKGNIQKLVDNKLNFANNDWAKKVEELKDLLPINSILEWKKTITEMLKTVVTTPVNILFKMIEKVIDLINQILGIPLNPTKIPDWAKGIIVKFKNLIELLIKLPTLEGMMDFLFLSPDGLTLIDIFIPGFSDFISFLEDKIALMDDQAKKYEDDINNLQDEINKNQAAKDNKLNQLANRLDLIKNARTNDINLVNKALLNKKNIILNNIDDIKEKASKLSGDILIKLNTEINEYCNVLENIEKQMKDNENLLKELSLKSDAELDIAKNNINNLVNEISNENHLEKQMDALLSEQDKIYNKVNSLNKKCEWNKNYNTIIELLNEFIDEEENKPNTYQEELEANEAKIEELKNLQQKLNSSLNTKLDETLNKKLININKEIKDYENFICKNQTDKQFEDYLDNLNELNRQKTEIENEIENSNPLNIQINIRIKEINEEIKKLESENKKLKPKADDLSTEIQENAINLQKISDKLPVVMNITCCAPKFIVNIFISIWNSIGKMSNLPDLWNFELI